VEPINGSPFRGRTIANTINARDRIKQAESLTPKRELIRCCSEPEDADRGNQVTVMELIDKV
jgi:hypothetical protein